MSKNKARPCDIAWIRSLVEQCKAAGVPCFVKQTGTWFAGKLGYRSRSGSDPSEWPEDLRVQELPR